MKNGASLAITLALALALTAGSASVAPPSTWAAPDVDDPRDQKRVDPDYQYATPQAYEDFADRKFGMRVHWGEYTVLGLKWPGKTLTLKSVRAAEGSAIMILGAPRPLPWRQDADALTITIPADIERAKPCRQAYSLKIEVATRSEGSSKQQ